MSERESKQYGENSASLSAQVEDIFRAFRDQRSLIVNQRSVMTQAGRSEALAPGSLWERILRQISTARADEDEDESWLLQAPLPLERGEPRHFGEFRPSGAAPTQPGSQPSDHRSLREIAVAAVAASEQHRATKKSTGLAQPDQGALPPPPSAAFGPTIASKPAASLKQSSASSDAVSTAPANTGPTRRRAPSGTAARSGSSDLTEKVALFAKAGAPEKRGEAVRVPRDSAALSAAPAEARGPQSWQSLWWLGSALAAAAAAVIMLQSPGPQAPFPVARDIAQRTAQFAPSVRLEATQPSVSEPSDGIGSLPTSAEATLPPPRGGSHTNESPAFQGKAAVKRSRTAVPPQASPGSEGISDFATEKVVLEEQPESSKSDEPMEPEMVPAAQSSNLAVRPSIGAAQGAIGAVLGEAKFCVLGDSQPSRATVVFGSSGRVSRVTVTGPSAGSPAESCIVRALRRARVQPFRDEEFSVRTTVRP